MPTRRIIAFTCAVFFSVTAVAETDSARETTHHFTRLDGLRAPGKIVRDDDGIPHIFALNEHDLIFLQGWAHARDRLFQMDFGRHQAEGTLAELMGRSALASDVQLRTFGLKRAADRAWPILSKQVQAASTAYAEGVNAYVTTHPLPPEYAALELTTFRPWAPTDSLAISKLVTFSLSFDLGDLDRTNALARYRTVGTAQG